MNILFRNRNEGRNWKIALFWTLKTVTYILMSVLMAIVVKATVLPHVRMPRLALAFLALKLFLEFRVRLRLLA